MKNKKLINDCLKVMAGSMQNRTLDKCSRYAVARRVMSVDEQGNPEFYSLDDYPYVEEILNSDAKYNWVMKCAQIGLSEAAITIAWFQVDYHRKSALYYFPTKVMADEFSKTRFNPSIDLSPHLKRVVTSKDLGVKMIGNHSLYIKGVNSEASLRGTSAGRLFFDELDAWTDRQVNMAVERASGQKDGDKKIWGFSTPRIPDRGVHKYFKRSTQEHYFFDCPHCGEEIELLWDQNVVVHGEYPDDPEVHKTYVKCHLCENKLDHKTKRDWLRSKTRGGTGHWKAMNPDADPKTSRGFWINQLYSPTVEPWEIAMTWLRGQNGDEAARTEFHNSKMGEPYIDNAHQVNDGQIDDAIARGGKYSTNDITLPVRQEEGVVTLGIDQGGHVHHWAAVAWKFEADKVGDPNDRAVGKVIGFGQILQDDWDSIHGLMRTYRVWRSVIDYFPEPTNARIFARKFKEAVYLCQYVKGAAAREVRITEDDYGAHLVRVDRTSWISKALGRIMEGTLSLPLNTTHDLRRQLKSPVRTLKEKEGQYVAEWVETTDDHYAHALTYAEIALKILDPSLNSSSILTTQRQ